MGVVLSQSFRGLKMNNNKKMTKKEFLLSKTEKLKDTGFWIFGFWDIKYLKWFIIFLQTQLIRLYTLVEALKQIRMKLNLVAAILSYFFFALI